MHQAERDVSWWHKHRKRKESERKRKEKRREHKEKEKEKETLTTHTHAGRRHLAGGSVYCHVKQIDNKVTITPASEEEKDCRLTVDSWTNWERQRKRMMKINTNDWLNKLLFNRLICYLGNFSSRAKAPGTQSTSDEKVISSSSHWRDVISIDHRKVINFEHSINQDAQIVLCVVRVEIQSCFEVWGEVSDAAGAMYQLSLWMQMKSKVMDSRRRALRSIDRVGGAYFLSLSPCASRSHWM